MGAKRVPSLFEVQDMPSGHTTGQKQRTLADSSHNRPNWRPLMKKQQSGFTLIELMIVVAIIGILAAIAIPSYLDYTTRAKISEGINLVAGAKAAAVDFYTSEGHWPTNSASAEYTSPSSDNVSGIAIAGTQITITYLAASGVGANSTIIFVGSDTGGNITWDCTGGDVASKNRPSNCR
jgi:type IV pilus assembly protein PilA